MSKVLSFIVIALFKIYKLVISPILPNACRYTPTCSEYGIQAVRKYGPFKGVRMALKRLSTCHPWGGHGHDPLK